MEIIDNILLIFNVYKSTLKITITNLLLKGFYVFASFNVFMVNHKVRT